MKISELIDEATVARNRFGDIDVYLVDRVDIDSADHCHISDMERKEGIVKIFEIST